MVLLVDRVTELDGVMLGLVPLLSEEVGVAVMLPVSLAVTLKVPVKVPLGLTE